MLLNMLRVEDANPENLVRSSFLQFQIEKDAPGLELEVPAVLCCTTTATLPGC